MDYDYTSRSYLLPNGYKDLINVIQPKTAVTESGFAITKSGFVVTALLPKSQCNDIEINVEGRILRITAKRKGGHAPFQSMIAVPSGYAVAEARATYIKGQLRIVIPKAAA